MKNILLLARSATTGAALREMEGLRDQTVSLPGVARVLFAFAEEGTPSLRSAIDELMQVQEPVMILPILVPVEPSFITGVKRSLQRWQGADTRPWPEIRIAPGFSRQTMMRELLAATVDAAEREAVTIEKVTTPPALEGSVVPAQRRRVLVCQGGPCIRAGAEMIWGHLRNEQKRLSLRTTGEGTMSAKTSCLGPCSLAPVLQVWPEGTFYGGVDEAGVDRIVESHLLRGEVVDDLAYLPTGTKQRLRG
ncbi:(2Fe-2S) ferredoxin domain-containing protein [Reyranella sp.]|uniref:(2Fe-2S) ferredoxin domain-containing protein n=1 Tax=Reyranella sp. TaxID=1929291 RepID=UPI0011F61C2D|nr:(2Fe-2S) ferredoxin domain-containing protein [Reyranella sp.]TAJ82147.1 MAG: NADH:ubiquinone oxidoreductase [Reyranella sp.]